MKRNKGRPGFLLVCRSGWESNPVICQLGGVRHYVNVLEGSWGHMGQLSGALAQSTLILANISPSLASSVSTSNHAPISNATLSSWHKSPDRGGPPLSVALWLYTPLTLGFLIVPSTPMSNLKTWLFLYLPSFWKHMDSLSACPVVFLSNFYTIVLKLLWVHFKTILLMRTQQKPQFS